MMEMNQSLIVAVVLVIVIRRHVRRRSLSLTTLISREMILDDPVDSLEYDRSELCVYSLAKSCGYHS